MNAKKFSDAISELDTKYVDEALNYKKKLKKPLWVKGAIAACFCAVLLTGVFFWKQSNIVSVRESGGVIVTKDGVTIPNPDISLSSSNNTADMARFFIYQGRIYREYKRVYSDNIVGELLGTAKGSINEWTSEDGFVELAGSVSGDFYAVNGYDPSFMLCMKYDNGHILTFVCKNGITLKYGSELFEDRLHLSGNFVAVECESWESRFYSKGNIVSFSSNEMDIVNSLINEMNAAKFIPVNDIPLSEEEESIFDKKIYYIYFKMQNGMTIELGLVEGGYVFFEGIREICVQISQDTFHSLISFLES